MNQVLTSNAWIKLNEAQTGRRVRLFCLPFAGGGSAAYLPWMHEIASDIEVCPVHLPGREDRLRETAFTRMRPLVSALAEALQPYLQTPFALYGHSLGALVAFELTRYLRRQGSPLPMHLFVSGSPAPQLPLRDEPISHLADAEFIQALRRFNGTPDSILQDAEIMRMLLPLLRADFTIYETYTYAPEEPLHLPISAYGGLTDFRAPRDSVEAWRAQTDERYLFRMYAGDHFFLNTKRKVLLQGIRQDLVFSPPDRQRFHSVVPAEPSPSRRETGPFCKAI